MPHLFNVAVFSSTPHLDAHKVLADTLDFEENQAVVHGIGVMSHCEMYSRMVFCHKFGNKRHVSSNTYIQLIMCMLMLGRSFGIDEFQVNKKSDA